MYTRTIMRPTIAFPTWTPSELLWPNGAIRDLLVVPRHIQTQELHTGALTLRLPRRSCSANVIA
eukprot:6014950-Alexandrium_andersonii.AAC.1